MSRLIPRAPLGWVVVAILLGIIALASLNPFLPGKAAIAQGGGGSNLTPEEEQGERPNEDDCEDGVKGRFSGDFEDCLAKVMADAFDEPQPNGPGGDGSEPNPEPEDDPNSPEAEKPPGERSAPGAEDEKRPGNGNRVPDTATAEEIQGQSSQGNDGESGETGDGANDESGGTSDGGTDSHCQSAEASAEGVDSVNPTPPSGSVGENPGHLNSRISLRYRSHDPMDGIVGVGWDANFLERLILNPTLNPNASLAWYPGNGSVHYFFFDGTNYTGEPAVQGIYAITTNPGSTSHRYVLTDKYGHATYFDTGGRITLKQDRHGNQNVYARDGAGRLVNISSSYGHTSMLAFQYHPTGRLQSVTDFSGRLTSLSYDATGHLTQVMFPASATHPGGKPFQYEYYTGTGNGQVDGKMKRILDPTGVTRVEWEYDATGKVHKLRRGDGMHEMTINALDVTTREIIDFNGVRRVESYQPGLHYPTRVEAFTGGLRGDDPPSYVWTYTFNAQRRVTQSVMPSGKKYEFFYDGNANLLKRRVTSAGQNPQTAEWNWTYGGFNLAASVTNPLGKKWTFTRNANGLITELRTPDAGAGGAALKWEYNASGQVTKVTGPGGRSISYTRYGAGPYKGWLQYATLSQTGGGDPGTCASGQTHSFVHNTRGYTLSITDPSGLVTTIERDGVDRITKVFTSGAVPYVGRRTYNALGIVATEQSEYRGPNGAVDPNKQWITRTYTYDPRRRVSSVTYDFDANGTAAWGFEQDGFGRVKKVTSPEGRVLQVEYDERGLPFRRKSGVTQVLTTTYAYHPNGGIKRRTDPLGNALTYQVDGFGRVIASTLPTGQVYSRAFDLAGCVVSAEIRDGTGALGWKHAMEYDSRNRVKTLSVDRFGHGGPTETATWSYDYDLQSNITKTTTPLGYTYSATYYSCGRPQSQTNDQTGGVSQATYDARGLLTKITRTEVEGGATKVHILEYDRDPEGRIIAKREEDADDPNHVLQTSYKYDSLGRLREVNAPEGVTSKYVYNYAGHMVERERIQSVDGGDPISHKDQFEWDKDGNLKSTTDATGAKVTREYDEHGRLTKITQPDLETHTFSYDVAGRVTGWTDYNGTSVTNAYDSAGRLLSRTIARASGVVGTTSETYSYDTYGRLKTLQDNDWLVELVRDSVGNILEEKQGTTQSNLVSVVRTFDKEGRVVTLTYPGSLVLDHTYDTAGRIHKVLQSGSTLFERSYVRTMLPSVESTLVGVSVRQLSHDGFNRVASHLFQKMPAGGGSPTVHFRGEYGYDDGHRRLYERRVHAGNAGDLYSYDDLGRVIKVYQGIADPVQELANPGSQTYTNLMRYFFDSVGARTSVTKTPFNGSPTTTDYSSNNLHQYTSVGGVTRGYDKNGNLASDGTYLYKYDYRNQLCEVVRSSDSSMVAAYDYDAFGRRVAKHIGTQSTHYFYDGVDIAEVQDTTGTVTHQFVYGAVPDELLLIRKLDTSDFDEDGNTSEFLWFTVHRGAANSVRLITDENGDVVESYTYDEYGLATIKNAAGTTITASLIGNPFTFTARQDDPETGLMYYRTRYYDPETGAFLQRDPIGPADGFNLYSYVSNSPFSFTDPFGRDSFADWRDRVFRKLGFTNTADRIRGYVYSGASTALSSRFDIEDTALQRYTSKMSRMNPNFAAGARAGDSDHGRFLTTFVSVAGALFVTVAGGEVVISGAAGGASLVLTGARAANFRACLAAADLGAAEVTAAGLGTAAARRLGRAGEAAVRAAHNIGPTQAISIAGRTRFPDGINKLAGILSEVKNVQSLSFTSQLRDYAAYASQSKSGFDLFVREGAKLSRPLWDAIRSGAINLRDIPK